VTDSTTGRINGSAPKASTAAARARRSVSGSDSLESRPGFAALLDRVENNGVRAVLVERRGSQEARGWVSCACERATLTGLRVALS
jgi:hypothetical protein